MKASLIFLVLLLEFSWGRISGSNSRVRRQAFQKPKPSAFQVKFKKGFNWREVTTEDKFYEMFPNIPRLPQHQAKLQGGFKPIRPGIKGIHKGPGNRVPGKPSISKDKVDTSTHCASRRTLIDLPITRSFGQHIFPSCAWVKRCSGCMCPDLMTCKPAKARAKTVDFYRINGHTVNRDKIPMTEHVQCACQCIKSSSSCTAARQVWNEHTCGCDCKPAYQEHNLNCTGVSKYDSRTCSCICPRAHESCPLGWIWSDVKCRCVEIRITVFRKPWNRQRDDD
ncbi:hypothetical protein ABFA07_014975 [Porites harrisoni]